MLLDSQHMPIYISVPLEPGIPETMNGQQQGERTNVRSSPSLYKSAGPIGRPRDGSSILPHRKYTVIQEEKTRKKAQRPEYKEAEVYHRCHQCRRAAAEALRAAAMIHLEQDAQLVFGASPRHP
jgi:hypothetical protein